MKMRPSPNTPANSAPETKPTPPMTSASTIGKPAEHRELRLVERLVVLREERAGESGDAGRQHEHRDLGLEHVHADRRRRGFAVAQRDSRRPNASAPERDDADAARSRTPR